MKGFDQMMEANPQLENVQTLTGMIQLGSYTVRDQLESSVFMDVDVCLFLFMTGMLN